jgi:hypothetical protein
LKSYLLCQQEKAEKVSILISDQGEIIFLETFTQGVKDKEYHFLHDNVDPMKQSSSCVMRDPI